MANYNSVTIDFHPAEEWIADILADDLADLGFEMFETSDNTLTAYIPAKNFNLMEVNNFLKGNNLLTDFTLSYEEIENQDWNQEWEKNYFQPIVVDQKCVVHSSFHTNVPDAEYDIVIDPKMAFGTGHHSTTMLMMQYILELDMSNSSVIDMGTGTAILSLLSKMRGAKQVTGIEIDPDACKNAQENAALNNLDITLICGDASALQHISAADYFFANINRNIITSDMKHYEKCLKQKGFMMLSGFYTEDIPIIMKEAEKYNLKLIETKSDKNWAAIKLSRNAI